MYELDGKKEGKKLINKHCAYFKKSYKICRTCRRNLFAFIFNSPIDDDIWSEVCVWRALVLLTPDARCDNIRQYCRTQLANNARCCDRVKCWLDE